MPETRTGRHNVCDVKKSVLCFKLFNCMILKSCPVITKTVVKLKKVHEISDFELGSTMLATFGVDDRSEVKVTGQNMSEPSFCTCIIEFRKIKTHASSGS